MTKLNVPIFKQTKMMWGPASLQMVLSYLGKNYDQKHLKNLLKSSILQGTTNKNMVEVSKKLGFLASFKYNSSIEEIKSLISKKTPPIISWFSPEGASHYSVVIGIDENSIYVADPDIGKIRKFKQDYFLKRWQNIDWENLSFFKKLVIWLKLSYNVNIKKDNDYIFKLKSEVIIKRELIIIKKL